MSKWLVDLISAALSFIYPVFFWFFLMDFFMWTKTEHVAQVQWLPLFTVIIGLCKNNFEFDLCVLLWPGCFSSLLWRTISWSPMTLWGGTDLTSTGFCVKTTGWFLFSVCRVRSTRHPSHLLSITKVPRLSPSFSGGLQPPLHFWDPQTRDRPPSSSQCTSRPSCLHLQPQPPRPGLLHPLWPNPPNMHTGHTLAPPSGTRPAVPRPPRLRLLPSGQQERRRSWSESCTTSSPTRSSGSTAS